MSERFIVIVVALFLASWAIREYNMPDRVTQARIELEDALADQINPRH